MFRRTFFRKATALITSAVMAASAVPITAYAAMNTSEFNNGYSYSTTMRGLSAFQIVNDMGAGWNLGNSLESDYNENYWGNPTTTKAMIDTIAARGFTTLRIPVRWDDNYTNASNYTINSSYMDRVETVVNYGLANDMYVILNVHHNDLQHNVPDTAAISAELSAIWTQIGQRFKNYGDKLIFEVNNEPRSGDDWTGNAEYYASVNACNEAARAAIRATGGNNSERLIMLPTYCASGDSAKAEAWTKNADDDMIAASIHAYLPFDFAFTADGHSDWLTSDLTELQGFFDRMYTYFLSKDIPVVIGEFGAVNKNNTAYREQYTAIYGRLARQFAEQDIPCVWWDNNCFATNGENFGIFNRSANSFVYDGVDCGGIADGLINAYEGDPVCETATTGETVIFEGSATASNYKQPVSFSPDYVTSMSGTDSLYVRYTGSSPYLVMQSWTNGDRWITVNADSDSGGVQTYSRSKLLSAFGGSFSGLDKVYISAQGGSTTVTKVYIPGTGAHTHNYNGTSEITIEATATTYGRKSIKCSVDGCDAVKITVLDLVEEEVLDVPSGTSAVLSGGSVKLTWNTVADATSYRVYRATSATGAKTLLKTVTATTYSDTSVTTGKTYYYFVAAYNANTGKLSDYSVAASVTTPDTPAAPTGVKVVTGGGNATITWNEADGATSYRVFRSTSLTGTRTLEKVRTSTYFIDTNVDTGKTYYYWIVSYNANTGLKSDYSSAVSVKIVDAFSESVTIKNISVTSTTATLTWDIIPGATSYRIYRRNDDGTRKLLHAQSMTEFKDTGLTKGKVYRYEIRAYSATTKALTAYSPVDSVRPMAAPTIMSGNVRGKITWDKNLFATSYRVYRAESIGGVKKFLAPTNQLTYTDSTAVDGKLYYYFVAGYDNVTGTLTAFSNVKAIVINK